MIGRLRAWLILGRVSNLPTVWSNLAAAWVLGGGPLIPNWRFACLLLGGSLLYVGGTALNDFFDADFDRRFRAERPIPRGALSRATVGLGAVALLLLGSALFALCQVRWGWLASLVAAIVLYDWLHKKWVGSVFLMGACRAFLVLAGASVFTVTSASAIHALALFGYIVGLTFTARGESRPEPPRAWPLALLFLPVVSGLIIAGGKGAAPWLACLALATALALVLAVLKRSSSPSRIGEFVSRLLALIPILDACAVVSRSWIWALAALACAPLARLLQRHVPAT